MDLQQIINEAKKLGSYLVTVTLRDQKKEENNLSHHVIRKEFDTADIIPSLDAAVRSMKITPLPSLPKLVIEDISIERKSLNIAIITHFNRMPQSYSPARAVRNQIKILKDNGHKVVFFTQEGSKLTVDDLGCEVRNIVPAFKREKGVINEEVKKKFIDVLRENLTSDFDIAITHDFFLQDTVTYSEGIRECNVPINWLHFARSGVGHSMDFSMPNARFVYLNHSDITYFARAIKVSPEQCRTVFNEKEPAFMFNWHPVTRMIVNKYHLWDRDIIQTYPMCSTRVEAKGLSDVIKTFVELKKLGNKVALIVPNSNGRKRVEDLKRIKDMANELGLSDDEFIFTSLLANEEYAIESEVPNQVCTELMAISNLFIFPTRAENGPNVLLEAAMTKNLLVLNQDLPLLFDFVDKENVLSYPFTSNRSLHYAGRDEESLAKLAKQIVGQLKSNKSDLTFRKIWRNHNSFNIYHKMLALVLFENIK